MYLLLLAVVYIVVAGCVLVVVEKKQLMEVIPEWAHTVSLAICWPIHLWSWFTEFRKELF